MESLYRIRAIIRKEIWHILRDWQTLFIILLMPILMMFLYGYALTLDMKDIPVIVVDESYSSVSQTLIEEINATSLFKITGVVPISYDIHSLFKKNRAKVVVVIPSTFARDLHRVGANATIQVLIDGSDGNIGTIVRNVAEPMIRKIVLDKMGIEIPKMITVQSKVLYNPEQKSSLFFIPGLMAMIMMMISAMLTSLTITREKEKGTMEQLLISPLTSWEILIGKLLPYVLLAILDASLILIVGKINFGTTVNGSVVQLYAANIVYIFTALSLGLIFSTVAKNQQQAMMMVLPVTMLPTIVLSGFIFPISSMPVILQGISLAVPATYFLKVIRAIILKGVGISSFWQPLAALAGMGILFFIISIRRFGAKR